MKDSQVKTVSSKSSQQTFDLGTNLGKQISQGICIALKGELGAGKTTFVQGFAKGLKVSEKYYITSPTFNIINIYPAESFTLCHIDLYRVASVEELEFTGFDDLTGKNHILIIEWPELLEQIDFKFDIEINFKFDDCYNRILSLSASGQQGSNLINKIVYK